MLFMFQCFLQMLHVSIQQSVVKNYSSALKRAFAFEQMWFIRLTYWRFLWKLLPYKYYSIWINITIKITNIVRCWCSKIGGWLHSSLGKQCVGFHRTQWKNGKWMCEWMCERMSKWVVGQQKKTKTKYLSLTWEITVDPRTI